MSDFEMEKNEYLKQLDEEEAADKASLSLGEEWYYIENKKRIGPISEGKIKSLFSHQIIDGNTLVWRTGFSDWVKLSTVGMTLAKSMPPPLEKGNLSNGWAWCLAFVPLTIYFFDIMQPQLRGVTYLAFLLNSLLCYFDIRVLKKAGYSTKTTMYLWAVFFVPVYLYKRARITKGSYSYFVVQCVSFAVILMIAMLSAIVQSL